MKKLIFILMVLVFTALSSQVTTANITYTLTRVTDLSTITDGQLIIIAGDMLDDETTIRAMKTAKNKSGYYMTEILLDTDLDPDDLTAEFEITNIEDINMDEVLWYINRTDGNDFTLRSANRGLFLSYTGRSTNLNMIESADPSKTIWTINGYLGQTDVFRVRSKESARERYILNRTNIMPGGVSIPRFACYIPLSPGSASYGAYKNLIFYTVEFEITDETNNPIVIEIPEITKVVLDFGLPIPGLDHLFPGAGMLLPEDHRLTILVGYTKHCSSTHWVINAYYSEINDPMFTPVVYSGNIINFITGVEYPDIPNVPFTLGAKITATSTNPLDIERFQSLGFYAGGNFKTMKENFETGEDAGNPILDNYFVVVEGRAINSAGLISESNIIDFNIQSLTETDGVFKGLGVWRNSILPIYHATDLFEHFQGLVGEGPPFALVAIPNHQITEGYTYRVVGRLSSYFGKTEIIPTGIVLVSSTPTALKINDVDLNVVDLQSYNDAEIYESTLIRFSIPAFTVNGSVNAVIGDEHKNYFTLKIDDGINTEPIVLRSTDERILDSIFNNAGLGKDIQIVGILEQYAPYDDDRNFTLYGTYRVFIRRISDVKIDGVPLSVTLSSFTATFSNNNVGLSWVTSSESNMMGFHVLRNDKNDLTTATRISENIIPARNTSLSNTYNFVDENATLGNEYWYWLQMIDNNWGFTHSEYTSVKVENEPVSTPVILVTTMKSVFPNPLRVGSTANFDVDVKEGETAVLRIFNVRGQVVKEFDTLRTGNHRFDWNLRDANNREVSSGVYFYQLISPTVESVQRMLIIR